MLESVQIVSFWSGFTVSGSVAKVGTAPYEQGIVRSVGGIPWNANLPDLHLGLSIRELWCTAASPPRRLVWGSPRSR